MILTFHVYFLKYDLHFGIYAFCPAKLRFFVLTVVLLPNGILDLAQALRREKYPKGYPEVYLRFEGRFNSEQKSFLRFNCGYTLGAVKDFKSFPTSKAHVLSMTRFDYILEQSCHKLKVEFALFVSNI